MFVDFKSDKGSKAMKRVRLVSIERNGDLQYLEAPNYPNHEVMIVDPVEDMVNDDGEEFAFAVGDSLEVEIPGADGSDWESVGEVVEIDDYDEPLLLLVKVNWGQATLVS